MQGKTLEPDRCSWEEQLRDNLAHAVMYAAASQRMAEHALVLLDEKHERSEDSDR